MVQSIVVHCTFGGDSKIGRLVETISFVDLCLTCAHVGTCHRSTPVLVRHHCNTNLFGRSMKQIIIRPSHPIFARSRARSGTAHVYCNHYPPFTRCLNRVPTYSFASCNQPPLTGDPLSALWCYRFPSDRRIIIITKRFCLFGSRGLTRNFQTSIERL